MDAHKHKMGIALIIAGKPGSKDQASSDEEAEPKSDHKAMREQAVKDLMTSAKAGDHKGMGDAIDVILKHHEMHKDDPDEEEEPPAS